MNQIDHEMLQTARVPAPWAVRIALREVVDTVLTWRERARMRRHLLALDDWMLKDIGISRSQAHGEAEKPFWRV